jgi:hypothetical protein
MPLNLSTRSRSPTAPMTTRRKRSSHASLICGGIVGQARSQGQAPSRLIFSPERRSDSTYSPGNPRAARRRGESTSVIASLRSEPVPEVYEGRRLKVAFQSRGLDAERYHEWRRSLDLALIGPPPSDISMKTRPLRWPKIAAGGSLRRAQCGRQNIGERGATDHFSSVFPIQGTSRVLALSRSVQHPCGAK